MHKYSSSLQLTNKVKLSEYRKQQVYILLFFESLATDGFQNSYYMRMRGGDTKRQRMWPVAKATMNVVSKRWREKWTPLKTWSQSSRTALQWPASMSFPYKHSLSRLELHVTICYCRSFCRDRGGGKFNVKRWVRPFFARNRATVTTCKSTQPQNSNHTRFPVIIPVIFAAINWFHLEPHDKTS